MTHITTGWRHKKEFKHLLLLLLFCFYANITFGYGSHFAQANEQKQNERMNNEQTKIRDIVLKRNIREFGL